MERSLMRMDLNLLKALHILLKERNVSRAAQRLFVTPSAMSKALHRLRETLNDPLLVRSAGGLVPTPRAEELAVLLNNAFAHLENLLMPASFDPARVKGRLRIAAPETFALGAIPSLLPALHEAAPGLHLELLHLGDGYLDRLSSGDLDFVIYLDQEYPEDFITHSLFSTAPKIWCRRDHPIVKLHMVTLEDICDYPKVAFHSPGIKLTELQAIMKALEQAGLVREVIFETGHLLVALVMLSQSDALMMAPDYLFQHKMFSDEVVSLSVGHIPLFDQLHIDLCLLQHERTMNSQLHQWVAAEMIRAVNFKRLVT
ncbi:MAG: LysR family transcriptional regulator [Sterolibacterium sp.]|nr:LysR family transcriptional regulator [Sterolibacterium sp.]